MPHGDHRPRAGLADGRLGFSLSILAGFISGGVLAPLLTGRLPLNPLWLLGAALIVAGLAYDAHRMWLRRRLGGKHSPSTDE